MRFLLAIVMIFAFQLSAVAQESADGPVTPDSSWTRSRDTFAKGNRDEAKVKAIIRDLLGDDSPKPLAEMPPVEETSMSSHK